MHEYKKIGEAWLLQGKYGRSFEYKNIGSKASEGIDDLLTLKSQMDTNKRNYIDYKILASRTTH